ncbi:MAG: eukaryotic-like serine/threonine-protein kinase [Thermoleophilaceae bacterium]|nr:eukaryotic-like serine/threonine-protein kinase [Thermoleophilaceae bacterium]
MPLGTTLLADRYRVIERVGSGGMATVLLAEDERLGRQVAVKRLHAESPDDTARRFRREARLGASLNHPNVVSVYDIVSDDEGVLIVMEYVEGETLRDAIERGPLPPARALEVLRGVAEALDHAHGEGIVHRDVKPANVLLGRDGRIKLADLGIATAVEGTRITMSGTVLGTAAYMAPEQLEGHKPGPAADVYSLAVLAWESLSGRRAYDGRTPLEIAHRKAAEAPPSLASVLPDAPPAAVDLFERAMGPDPAARPPSATAFVGELERALAGPKPVSERPTAPHPGYVRHTRSRSQSRLLPVLGLLLGLALVVGVVLASTGGGGDSSKPADASAKKHAKKHKQPKATQQSAATSYQVPQPAGTSATEGWQLNNEGKALSDSGEYASAIPTLERAAQAFPAGTTAAGNLQYAYTLFNLGHALVQAGRPADAVPVLEERLKNPDQRATVQAELDAARQGAAHG